MYLREAKRQGADLGAFIGNATATGLLFSWGFFTFAFAIIYWVLAEVPDGNGLAPLVGETSLTRFFEAFYYSVIVATTTGLGDISPYGVARFFTAVQATFSFILLAAFVSKFATQKQEKVLEDIHQLSFDSSFHTIRNGLFIARKDVDAVIRRVLEHGSLTEKDWLNLKTALRQMQIFIKHIPDFYRKTAKTHDFDIDREMLLVDSLGRTLTRLVEALELFDQRKIGFFSAERVVREFSSLVAQIENMSLHEEQKTLDPENHEAFQEILNRTGEIRAFLERAK